MALTLLGLLAVFLLLTWWEARSGLSMAAMPRREEAVDTFGQKLMAVSRPVFVRGWSPVVGGAVLGGIVVMMYMVHMPWGVTGELSRWSNGIMPSLGFGAPVAEGAADIGGCAARINRSGVFSHTFSVTVGLLPGALVAALFAREFKLRFPRGPQRYLQSLGGGILMGYGSGLAIGCTIGAFFSSISSLSLSGWLFGLALAGGPSLVFRLSSGSRKEKRMFLDLHGEECPVPTVRSVEAIKGLKGSDETIVVVTDDAVCAEEIPFQAGQLGYMSTREEAGASEWTIRLEPGIRRGAGAAVTAITESQTKITQHEPTEDAN